MDDLDDLLDDNVPMQKATTTVAQRNKSAAMGRFGSGASKKDDLDDLGDSFNFDDIGGVSGSKPTAAAKKGSMSFGGANLSSNVRQSSY